MKWTIAMIPLLALAGCGDDGYTLTANEKLAADNGAITYSQAAGGTYVQCSGLDSDGDSYVTCTYKDKSGAMTEIACSYKSVGCKPK